MSRRGYPSPQELKREAPFTLAVLFGNIADGGNDDFTFQYFTIVPIMCELRRRLISN